MNSVNCCATSTCDLVFGLTGMDSRFENGFGGTEKCLRGKLGCDIAWKTLLDSAVRQSLNHDVNVSWSRARESSDGMEFAFFDDLDETQRPEDFFCYLEVTIGMRVDRNVLGQCSCASTDLERKLKIFVLCDRGNRNHLPSMEYLAWLE